MRENGELYYYKANKLVQDFSHSLNKMEIRIVNYLIANIRSPKYDEELHEMIFDMTDFVALLQLDGRSGSVYKRVEDTIQKLRNKAAWQWVEDPKTGKKVRALLSWIEKPRYDEDGKIILEINPLLAPYLIKLGEDNQGFFKAKYDLSIIASSKYTVMLYELLRSWEGLPGKVKVKSFEISDFRFHMDAEAKTYDNFAQLKRRVIDTAVNEINELTELNVKYETQKHGKKIAYITFEFSKKIDRMPSVITVEDEEKYKSKYGVMLAEFPEFNGPQVEALYNAVSKHIDLMSIDRSMRVIEVIDFITPKWLYIKSTPEKTKTTNFQRLLDAVKNNY